VKSVRIGFDSACENAESEIELAYLLRPKIAKMDQEGAETRELDEGR
jgi:hypothetical protein